MPKKVMPETGARTASLVRSLELMRDFVAVSSVRDTGRGASEALCKLLLVIKGATKCALLLAVLLFVSIDAALAQDEPVKKQESFVPVRRSDIAHFLMTTQTSVGGPISRSPITDLYLVFEMEDGSSIEKFFKKANGQQGPTAIGTLFAVVGGRLMISSVGCREWVDDRAQCYADCDGGGISLLRNRDVAGQRLEFSSKGITFQSICGGDDTLAQMVPSNSRSASLLLRPRNEYIESRTEPLACVVRDPTGTPLNVRQSPGGTVKFALPNGTRVSVQRIERDSRGRDWALITGDAGQGWAIRTHIGC